MNKRVEMNSKLLSALMERVNGDNVPVNISEGKSYTDFNGNKSVDVLLECDDRNDNLINRVICETINKTFGVVCG